MARWVFALLAATVLGAPAAAQPSLVERGDYLVNGILTCGNCHTPRGPKGVFDTARQFSGGPQTWDEPSYTVKGSNITTDPETGIGKWTDSQIKASLQQGVRPDGTQLAPQMPYMFYRVFTPRDLDAVTAYLKSLKPVPNAVQPPIYKAAMHADAPPGTDRPMTEKDMADPVKRGFYLVTIGHCMECHTSAGANGHPDYRNGLGKGGKAFKGPWGVAIARNITSHKTAGIGGWTDQQIKDAIAKGVRPDGSALKPPMGYPLYARMTEQDMSAIVAYLRTVPAKE